MVWELERVKSKTDKIEKLLIGGGFLSGVDYINDFEIKTITKDSEFGYSSEKFNTEVTYVSSYGGCKLITDYYDSNQNQIIPRLISVGEDYDKLECSTVTNQYRSYKPSSLLSKLKKYNASQLEKFKDANRDKMILDYTIEKYKTLFPNAEVTVGSDYSRIRNNYTEFKIVYVKFKSGSYVSFRLGYEKDKEYIHKKFDEVASKMTAMEILNIFNNQ